MRPIYRLSSLAKTIATKANQSKSIRKLQNWQLRLLVEHIYHNVPYYSSLMRKHKLYPRYFRTVDDLKNFPITYKKNLQQYNISQLLDRNCCRKKLVVHRTSGSTGQPFQIYRSWLEERIYGAYRWSVLARYGYKPYRRHAEVEELQSLHNGDQRTLHRYVQKCGLFRQRRIQGLNPPEQIRQELEQFQPTALTGYSGVIYRLAASISHQHRIKPRFIACHSDLLNEGMRSQISQVFRAPVFEIYDAYEVNVIGWQCPQSSLLHTSDNCVITELINSNGQAACVGECGEVVLTALHSFTMPFIRFAIGDLAHKGKPCPCGCSSTLERINGRTVEYFVLPNNRVIHPYEIYALFEKTGWIQQYQLVQKSLTSLEFVVIPNQKMGPEEIISYEIKIRRFLGPEVSFSIKTTQTIQPERSGKTPAFRSLVGKKPLVHKKKRRDK